jgi:TIGR03009 family protein
MVASSRAQGTRDAARPPERAAAGAEDREAQARLDGILARWERQSADARTLDARFTRVDRSPDWQMETRYEGRVLLRSPNKAYLNLVKAEPGRREARAFHERIVCTGERVYRYAAQTRQVFVAPLDEGEAGRVLDEGPLPFLFNMRAEEAKARYRLVLDKQDVKRSLIQVYPLRSVDRARFYRVDVVLDRETSLPEVIRLVDPNGRDTQTYTFRDARRDAPIDASWFEPTIPKGWSVVAPNHGDPSRPGRPPSAIRR